MLIFLCFFSIIYNIETFVVNIHFYNCKGVILCLLVLILKKEDFPLLLHIDEILSEKKEVNIPWNEFTFINEAQLWIKANCSLRKFRIMGILILLFWVAGVAAGLAVTDYYTPENINVDQLQTIIREQDVILD